MGYYWGDEEVDEKLKHKLKHIMTNAFRDIHQTAQKYQIDLRTAAYVTAAKKVVDAMQALGHI